MISKETQEALDPLVMKHHPDRGRFLVAGVDITKNQQIFTTIPSSIVPDSLSLHRICSGCVAAPQGPIKPPTERPLLPVHCTIPSCNLVSYCSSECCIKDAPIHLLECKFWTENPSLRTLFMKWDGYTQDYMTLLIRLLARSKLDHIDFTQVWNMCDNVNGWSDTQLQKFIEPATLLSIFSSFIGFSYPKFDTSILDSRLHSLSPSHPALAQTLNFLSSLILICKEECNSFGLYTHLYTGPSDLRQGYALALYPTAVFFNHDCTPSITRSTTIEGAMVFKTARELKQGEEASISYVDEGMDSIARRKVLKDWFLFECGCKTCVTNVLN